MTVRRAGSQPALRQLLDSIDRGSKPKPDWIHLQRGCRIEELPAHSLEALVARLHRCVLRGFRLPPPPVDRSQRLALWRTIARNGFHDFTESGWTKCYDSPVVENYDYVSSYLSGGIDQLDPYRVYSAVLGTHDYTIEDFSRTHLCKKVRTVAEPMAGSADFSYAGHYRFPDFRYVMFDLDRNARDHVLRRAWLPDSDHQYVLANVLDESIWQHVKSLTTGESLSYLGKQSHSFFDAKQLYRLLDLATRYVDYFMLEVPEPSLVSELDHTDLLTRTEMEDAGFQVALVDESEDPANPFTNRLRFRLDAWDSTRRRALFQYGAWTSWQHPTLVVLGQLLDLRVLYFHSELHEFLPVEEAVDSSDVLDNVSFMLFTRRR